MTGKHLFETLPPQVFLQACSPSGCLPATERRRRWGKLASSVSFCTALGAPLLAPPLNIFQDDLNDDGLNLVGVM